jgi:hypothetical protein
VPFERVDTLNVHGAIGALQRWFPSPIEAIFFGLNVAEGVVDEQAFPELAVAPMRRGDACTHQCAEGILEVI